MNFESSIVILEDSLLLKHYILIFISGLIASISLVLPGISGALMLVVLGLYMPLLESLKLMVDCLINFKLPQIENLMFILVFFISFIIGLIGSSKIIDKFINRHGKLFEALINGMMLGSIVNMMGIIALLEAGLIEILIGLILYAILVLYLKLIVA